MTAAAATVQSQTDNTAENYNPIKGQRFFPIPASVASRPDLSTNAKMVYGYLCSCYGRNGLVCPKISTISNQCGLSPRTAGRAVTELKQAGLIVVMRTGRASYYRFINPDQRADILPHDSMDQVPVDQPEPENRSAKPSLSDTPNLADHTPIYKKELSKKKTTTKPRVVVLPDEDQVKECMDAVPEKYQTPTVERTLRIGITNSDIDDILKAIEYTTAYSRTNYSAYLGKTIRERWYEDWTPPAVQKAKKDADIQAEYKATIEANDTALQQADTRAALAAEWLSMSENDRAEIRTKYLEQCNAFEMRRAVNLSDEQLIGNIGFKLFLESKERKIYG